MQLPAIAACYKQQFYAELQHQLTDGEAPSDLQLIKCQHSDANVSAS